MDEVQLQRECEPRAEAAFATGAQTDRAAAALLGIGAALVCDGDHAEPTEQIEVPFVLGIEAIAKVYVEAALTDLLRAGEVNREAELDRRTDPKPPRDLELPELDLRRIGRVGL